MEWLSGTLGIGWVDLAMLGVLAVSAAVGALRGLTFELFSLAGWIAAWIGGFWLGPTIAPHLPFGTSGSAANLIVGFACAFLLVLFVGSIGARLAKALVAATPLRPVDRLLGAVFGLLRGLLVLLAVAAVVAWTPPARTSSVWRESHGAVWLSLLLDDYLIPLVWPRSPASGDRQRV